MQIITVQLFTDSETCLHNNVINRDMISMSSVYILYNNILDFKFCFLFFCCCEYREILSLSVYNYISLSSRNVDSIAPFFLIYP